MPLSNLWLSFLFVLQCGNFAVLVDLHVLPLGGQEDASWFTTDHIEVKTQGEGCVLVASFLKRHFSLKCIVKQHYGGTYTHSMFSLSEQSRSEYFSKVGETQEPLNSPAKTKKTVTFQLHQSEQTLMYLFISSYLFNFFRARQASVQQELGGLITGKQRDCPEDKRETESEKVNLNLSRTVSHGQNSPPETQPQVHYPSVLTGPVAQIANNHEQGLTQMLQNENTNSNEVSGVFCPYKISQETSKTKSDAGEDPYPQRAKRACLGRPPATTQPPSIPCSSQTSKLSECKKTTLEVELLTPGKRAQRLPLTSNNTAQTNQNRLAASLRGLSVKPASSGSSISSRSTLREEGSENVPRTSRLRRLKRS
uniref:SLX4 interacting protein n=1 Tax=Sphaeramia orbicularis TaxID=375764 RepID=A0A673BWF8_9TELE